MRSLRRTIQEPAVRQGLAVAVATSAYGISFGALSVASGLDVWQTCVLSLVMFTGGSQFAFVGVIAAGGLAAAPAAIASAGLLGVRNAAYAMRMSPVIGPPDQPCLSRSFRVRSPLSFVHVLPRSAERNNTFAPW